MRFLRFSKRRPSGLREVTHEIVLSDLHDFMAPAEVVTISTPGGEKIRMHPGDAVNFARRLIALAQQPIPST